MKLGPQNGVQRKSLSPRVLGPRRTGGARLLFRFALIALLSARPSPRVQALPPSTAPWERAAFSADPKETRSAADRLPPPDGGAASEVLFEEARYSFDSAGRRRFQLRTVIRVVTAADSAGWSSFQRA